jgi:transcription factor SPT20
MSCYNITRSAEQLLEAYEDAAPSFSLHLHPDYWTLNNGPKFLYNNPIAVRCRVRGIGCVLTSRMLQSLLDDVRAHRIPVDYLELFDIARVPFYDGELHSLEQGLHFMLSLGCMLVELLDYRPKRAKDPPLENPERSRVALHPNNETLWANLCLMNQRSGNKFTDSDVLDLEAQILVSYIHDLSYCNLSSL